MLKKINRGLNRKDFEISREKGKLLQSPLFGVSIVESERTQIGFVISKKISKRAVDRNRIKRRLSEVIKDKLPSGGFKIVILVKKNILNAEIEDISKCWEMIYEKIDFKDTSIL